MAALRLDGSTLSVVLTRWEKVLSLRRADLVFPLAALRSAEVAERPERLLRRSWRSPGLGVGSGWRVGVFRTTRRRVFAAFRVARPALGIGFAGGQPMDEVILTLDDPAGWAARLNATLRQDTAVKRERPISFRSADLLLNGTLTSPAGAARGVAVLLPGSGPIDRDSNHGRILLGVTAALAQALADNGIASLRYDKRGVGSSSGDQLTAGFTDLVNDARSACEAVADDRLPLFLIGHSEGAMLAEALAGPDDGRVPELLAGVVLLAGAAGTGEQTLRWQATKVAEHLPTAAKMIVKLTHTDVLAKQSKAFATFRATTDDTARIGGKRMNARWWREMLDFDAAEHLRRITVPVLAIAGTKDIQVDPDGLLRIADCVPGEVTTRLIPDLTHLLRREPGEPSVRDFRRQTQQPVDAELLRIVSDWIVDHAAGTDR